MATAPPKFDPAIIPGFYVPPVDLDPRPPYQFRGCTHLFLCGRANPAHLALLPPTLRPVRDGYWSIIIFQAPEGWGMAPFSAFFFGVDVAGHNSADGNVAVYTPVGTYSGRAGQIMPRDYSPAFRAGDVTLAIQGDHIHAEAELDGDGARISFRARILDQTPSDLSGMVNYLAKGPDGDTVIYTNTHSAWVTETTDLTIETTLPPGHRMEFLNRLQIEWSVLMSDVAFTMGAPMPLGQAFTDDEGRLAFLGVLARLGQPIAIVEQTGRIAYLTAEAQALLRDDLGATFTRLPAASGPRPHGAAPALLTLSSGRQLAARAFSIALRLGQGPLSLVLLTDPREPGPTDPEPLLRLMGLTPSEAALAALIGQGLAPAEAARLRGITQTTARSMLKFIFGKLGVTRQSELAILVTRLQSA